MSTPIEQTLGKVILAPTPRQGRTLPEIQQNIAVWTRQAEQTVRQFERALTKLTLKQIPVSIQGSPANGSATVVMSSNLLAVRAVVLCSAFTPTATGADTAEIEVPYDLNGSSVVYNVTRILLRVAVAGGAPSVTIEKSSGTGSFNAITVGTVTLSSDANESAMTISLGTVVSGDKLRFNVRTLGTAQAWMVMVEIASE